MQGYTSVSACVTGSSSTSIQEVIYSLYNQKGIYHLGKNILFIPEICLGPAHLQFKTLPLSPIFI
jgi:hypothetical protein